MSRTAFKIVSVLVVLILIGAGLVAWKADVLYRLYTVNTLFEPDRIVHNFSHMDEAFLHEDITLGDGPASTLPAGPAYTPSSEINAWLESRNATSIVVLKDGALVHEAYRLGTAPDDLRISWSVAKSFLSALTGIVIEDGFIGSLDHRVIDYVPALRGTAYQRATIRHVLNMATGVTFDEDYLDKSSDINRMGRVLALGGEMDEFTTELSETFAEPGTDWQYVSIDTHVLGMVLRKATGRSIPDLMGEKIIRPLGLERAPYYLTDGTGVAFVLGGLNMSTRDYARFGQMIAQGGQWNGQQIVPRAWVQSSTTPSAPTDADEYGYGYQWWIPQDATPREYVGRGIYGQYLYINEPEGVVISLTATDLQFRAPGVDAQNIEIFRQIADAL